MYSYPHRHSIIKMGKAEKSKVRKKLVIVESPSKTRSLAKFLGKDYEITSSKGHLIDLPKSRMGIDINNDFQPEYMTIRGKGKILAELKRAAKRVMEIILATDPDREGEAISWHLARVLAGQNQNIKRIEFNEITKDAVLKAIQNPREIDMEKVNSQQARRLLDRLVGYSISPVLQEKFGSKRFSAGRVQSVALRILCDREDQIEKFIPKEYWEFEACWNNKSNKKTNEKAVFKLVQIDGEKLNIASKEKAQNIEGKIRIASFKLSNKKETQRRSRPAPPYTTSKLQQEASSRFGFRAQKTMSIAQSLYEGVPLGADESISGLVTYIRTDSVRISEIALGACRNFIKKNYSAEYLPPKANVYASSAKTQDAHEAIRPTNVDQRPGELKQNLTPEQYKLYNLIWQKFVASQMTPSVDAQTTLEIKNNKNSQVDQEFLFRFTESREVFPGFRAVLPREKSENTIIPNFETGESVNLVELNKYQKFTQPPPRYTEASLIKVMEESGIGRPATYAPTINVLDKRSYIERKGRQLIPTTLGRVVNEMMLKHFTDIVNIQFTAGLEEKLDEIAEGNNDWRRMLGDFFQPFKTVVDNALKNMESKIDLVRIPLDKKCPNCEEGMLMKKLGKNGFFIGCNQFQSGCRYTESISLGICPLCKGDVVRKKSKKGRNFYGCSNYTSQGCEFIMQDKPASKMCPFCNTIMGERVRKNDVILTCQNRECNRSITESSQESSEKSVAI